MVNNAHFRSLALCGLLLGATLTATAQSRNPGNYTFSKVTPADVEQALAGLDTLAPEMLTRSGVPGMAIAVVYQDQLVYAKGFGVKQAGSDNPVDAETVFQLASLSKSVGATAVATAVSDGTVAWDDRIADLLPGFTLADPFVTEQLTVADLYSHRSGLPDHAGDLLEDIGYSREEVFARLKYLPLDSFRASYHYTNFGMTVAAVAMASRVGQSWEEFSRTRLYEPLGMDATSSTYADFMARDNKALGSVKNPDGTWSPTPQQRQPDAQSPAGGVSSNVLDMAKWMRLVLAEGTFDGEQLVEASVMREVLTPHANSSAPSRSLSSRPGFYGYGVGIGVDASGRVRLSHSGAFVLGTGTAYALVPAEQLGIIVLTNGTPVGLPEAVIATFLDRVESGESAFDWLGAYGQLFAPLLANPSVLADQEHPVSPAPAPASGQLTGSYANDTFGPLSVTEADDGLTLALGPAPMTFPLTHWDGTVFAYHPAGENATGIAAVTFTLGPDRQATAVTVENLDEHGQGTFTR
jgi:CubicO group peptidase (beta-lactamase class C family)